MQKSDIYKSEKQYYSAMERKNNRYIESFPCWQCGKEMFIELAEPMERLYCAECYDLKLKAHKQLVNDYTELKAKVMFENAIRIMEKSNVIYMHEYLHDCNSVYEMVTKEPNNFKSSYEIIIAIILTNCKYEFNINYQISNYRVDFYIPELFICLEVDGDRHKHKLVEDNQRDIALRNHLGAQWEIIHIPTEYIDKNAEKIFDVMESAREMKKKLRQEPGQVNTPFSKREKEHYKKIIGS